MKFHFKSLLLGFLLASLMIAAGIVGLLLTGVEREAIFHEQVLPSGSRVKIMSFQLAWGIEHEDRRSADDQLTLEYVSSAAQEDEMALDLESRQVFELIRPVSEQWGFAKATLSAFPTLRREGKYAIYAFSRAPDGAWTFTRHWAKVHIDD